MSSKFLGLLGLCVVVVLARAASAQLPNPYGASITGDSAKKVAAAALAEARRNNWTVAAAVVDPAGDLVYFEKVDGTQAASSDIAVEKARSASQAEQARRIVSARSRA